MTLRISVILRIVSALYLLPNSKNRYIGSTSIKAPDLPFDQKFCVHWQALSVLSTLYLSDGFSIRAGHSSVFQLPRPPSISHRSSQPFAPSQRNTCPFTSRHPFSSRRMASISSRVKGSERAARRLDWYWASFTEKIGRAHV